ncbi:hypothetical protein [Methylobacterium oryzisoli]|uniref:hypothetical protein n=1 Tax=Methylobacterium oryzisoli TaxID=3385502 RepID=UPI00389282CD
MRITIDMSDAESRSATIHPTLTEAAGVEEPATNGGAAPVSLLMALGVPGQADAAIPADPTPVSREGLDGGGAPEWLTGVIEGGR